MSYPAKIQIKGGVVQLVVKVGERWRKGVETRCAWCAFTLYLPEHQMKRYKDHFCSLGCIGKANTAKTTYATNYCMVCSNSYRVSPPAHARRYKTCSPECKQHYRYLLTKSRRRRKYLLVVTIGSTGVQGCCSLAVSLPSVAARLR